ncbi:Regucalcin [Grifola frondosa]|uniref:Regucalcin n=1 Tax=Grifola frondosa TaxID=5627 RepID=A0A1C7MSA1_GRIFR|nr:Regucalcin [Grifola frondosa]
MSSLRRITVKFPLLQTNCKLGEGPIYDSRTSTLHFVDIEQNKVLHYTIPTSELIIEHFEDPVTCLAFRRNGDGLACVTAQGFAVIEGNSALRYLCKPIPSNYRPFTRFNDGACDSKGRFIAGTIFHKDSEVPGQLYMYDPEGDICTVIDPGPFTDSNGLGGAQMEKPCFSPIHALSQGLPEGTYPDGLCIDKDGGIWSARWGGSRIIRYTRDGAIDLEVFFPTALNITACCFGGPNNDQLYVTTAHCGACGGDASRQALYPDSGNLFVVDLSGQFQGGMWRYAFAG